MREVTIDSTEFNPFNGLLVADNLTIATPDGRGVRAGRVVIDLSRSELFERRIYLHDVVLRDASVDLVRTQDGVYLAGFPPAEKTASAEAEEEDGSWLFGLDELVLRNAAITVHDGDESETARIARAHLSGIAMWDTERTGQLSFGIKLPFGSLSVNGQMKPLGETKFFRGTVTIDSLDVARSVRLADPDRDAPAQGTVTSSLQVDAEIGAGQTIKVMASGELSTDRLVLAGGVRLDGIALREVDARYTLGSGGSSARLTAGVEAEKITLPIDGGAFQTANLRWNGRIEETTRTDGRVNFLLIGALAQGATRFAGADGLNVSYGALDANNIRVSGDTDEKGNTKARIDGGIDLSQISVRTPEMTFTEPRLGWQGDIRVSASAGAGAGYDFDGQLKAGEARIELPASGVQAGFGNLQWSGRAGVAAGQGGRVTHNGSLTVEGVGLAAQRPVESQLDVEKLSLDKVVSGSDGKWDAERVSLAGLAVESDGPVKSAASVDTVELESLSGDPTRNWSAGSLAVKGIRVDAREPAINVFTAGRVTAQGVSGTADGGWTSESAAIRDVVALSALSAAQTLDGQAVDTSKPSDPPLKLDALVANRIGHNGASRLTVENVLVNGFSAELVREENEKIRLFGSVIALANGLAQSSASSSGATGAQNVPGAASATRPTGSPDDRKADPLTFHVGEWRIGENSRLVFIDRSVQPAVDITLEELTGNLRNVDSAQPDKPVPIELQAQAGEFGKLQASGTIQPFAERLSLDIDGTLTGFELPQISGYARSMLGYAVARGRLDARFDVIVQNGKLDGDNRLTISKLKVEKAIDGAKKGGPSIPLETALSLLRNSNDVIELQLPVDGDIANPKFDFSDAINQAIGGAIRKAVTTTLSLTFPLGGVIKAISKAGQPDRLGLQPVSFEPGDARVTPDVRNYLDGLARMLKERPDVKLTICGVATARDRQALQDEKRRKAEQAAAKAAREKAAEARARRAEQKAYPTQPLPEADAEPVKAPSVSQDELLKLSGNRGTAVKSELVENLNVPESRLYLCEPEVDEDSNGDPRAEILL